MLREAGAAASSLLSSVDERRASVPVPSQNATCTTKTKAKDNNEEAAPPLLATHNEDKNTPCLGRIDKMDEVVVIDGILKADDDDTIAEEGEKERG